MRKLKKLFILVVVLAPMWSYALSDSVSKDLISQSLKSAQRAGSKTHKIQTTDEFRDKIVSRSVELKEGADSDFLASLNLNLVRSAVKKGTPEECNASVANLLADSGIPEKDDLLKKQSWPDKEKTFKKMLGTKGDDGDISEETFIAFQFLKAICE